METSIKSSEVYQLCKQISILANDLERYEKQKIKSINFEEENKIITDENRKLKTQNNKVIRENNNLTIKIGNLQKRIDRYEEIYSSIPGTSREDKYRFLLFIANQVLPWLIESSYSRTFKKVVEFWDTFIKKQENDKKYIPTLLLEKNILST